MSAGVWFWLIWALCVLFAGWLLWPFALAPAGVVGVIFVLLGLLGWKAFGPPIQ